MQIFVDFVERDIRLPTELVARDPHMRSQKKHFRALRGVCSPCAAAG